MTVELGPGFVDAEPHEFENGLDQSCTTRRGPPSKRWHS
jgi:hypothetical protein